MQVKDIVRLGLFGASLAICVAGCKDKPAQPTDGGKPSTNGTKTETAKGSRPITTGAGNSVVGDEILVGEFASMTGSTSTFGIGTHNGIQMAVDEINAKGGIKGKKIKLVTEDDESKAEKAATVVNKLCSDNKVVAVLGEVASTRSMRGGTICQKFGIPMITPSSTNPKVTEIGDCVFRVCFTDDFQPVVAAQFAADQGYKNVAILTDIKNDYSVGFAGKFKDEFTKRGGKIAGESSYQEGDADFKAQLNTLKGSKPDAILIPGYYGEVGTIARQCKDVGLNVPLFGGDGWDSPKLVPGAGTALEGNFFVDHYFSTELTEKATQDFIASFKKKYNVNPDALSALGYDAAMLLFDAMNRAKTLDSKGIRDAIAETKDLQGVTGKVTIDAQGNARKSALVLQIKGQSFKVFKSYDPDKISK